MATIIEQHDEDEEIKYYKGEVLNFDDFISKKLERRNVDYENFLGPEDYPPCFSWEKWISVFKKYKKHGNQ